MSSNSKRRKRPNARQRKDVHKIFHDRLTNLPNSLKTEILSCLSTIDAVKTSILSKEWKWSWTSVTNLDFDDNSVIRPYKNDYFTNFVNRVLLLRDRSYLQRFRMKCYEYCEGSLINAWIAAALLSNVKEIDLSVQSDGVEDPFMLHCDVFLCKTLVVLKLDTRSYVNLPASVSLPGLKTLHISNVKFSDDVSIVSLLSGAPVLEELLLSLCIGEDVRVVNISAPALTSLTMENLPCEFDRPVGDYNYQVVIDTPSLKYLNFSDYAAQGYEVKNLNHLIKAEINVGCPVYEEQEFIDLFIVFHSKPLTDFLVGISQVQSLVISDESMEALCSCDVALPTFSNLTHLELDHLSEKLLEKSPCLETLYLRKCHLSIEDMPPCFLSRLKVIKIDGYSMWGMEMVEYFLKNAKVLEKLTIIYRSFDADHAKQLLKLPRSSPICIVEIL